MPSCAAAESTHACLPSHEGSGLKLNARVIMRSFKGLPSHEGSGLKFNLILQLLGDGGLPSHEGSGLK